MSMLDQRIAEALSANITSADLSALIAEVEVAAAAADTAAEQARTRALDPVTSPDADEARAAMEAAAFNRDRLHAALPRLRKRLQDVVADEQYAAWLPKYEAVKARQVALAQELADFYPGAAVKLADLLLRIEAADGERRSVSFQRPPTAPGDAQYLPDTEQIARGSLGVNDQLILRDLRLPNWEPGTWPAWPPHRPLALSMVAPVFSGDPRLHSDRWQEALEERQRAALERAEQEEHDRVAKALENYHGPRWWERQ